MSPEADVLETIKQQLVDATLLAFFKQDATLAVLADPSDMEVAAAFHQIVNQTLEFLLKKVESRSITTPTIVNY